MNKREIGKIGEEKARKHLELNNYKVLKQNYYCKYGEIDLIVIKNNVIVFVEVKYRRSNKFGYAEEAVNNKKMKKIYLSAMNYINEKNIIDKDYRFDIFSINGKDINWIKNSYWGDGFEF